MSDILPLSPEWKDRLGLGIRRSPEFYESVDAVLETPHALAIRTALSDLRLSAIFCVQGVPTIAVLRTLEYDNALVVDVHGALWNQGLASLLLVISGDTLRAFSLARMPQKEWSNEFDERCLLDTLNATADALKIRNLVYGAESGRLWKEYANQFKPKERVDQVLLENLNESHKALCRTLSAEASQTLLIQAMFISYLEDREIITPDYFREATHHQSDSLLDILEGRDIGLLKSLFDTLKRDFNANIFVAPCTFEHRAKKPAIHAENLDVLARFRSGREEMGRGGQYRFWGYHFRYIPVELVSAVYDRFLGEREEERKKQGAYYTPMYLADTVVSQIWDFLSDDSKQKGRFLDPACGSGVFLVRSFQRLCEHWRATHVAKTIRWDSLLSILERVHGWDLNGGAIRVAIFSLYVALLEEVSPPDIRALLKKKKVLPKLWGRTLIHRDFFSVPAESVAPFDVIVGNPPWTSRRGLRRSSVRWSAKYKFPMPGREDAWAFTWKSLRHLSNHGVAALLLPAMGFLHNHAASSVSARKRLFQESRVCRVINFADLRFQLFDRAIRPAALMIFRSPDEIKSPYQFQYWAPKADLNLQIKRMITLSSADKFFMNSGTAQSNALAFKHLLWMREPEAKLFSYFSKMPTLGQTINDYGSFSRRRQSPAGLWVIGMGYQPYNEPEKGKPPTKYWMSKFVGSFPDLPIGEFIPIAQAVSNLSPWHSKRVRRKGFEDAFVGPKILVPRTTSQGRLRATYTESKLTFQDIMQAITVPAGQTAKGKLLTALLNSRVAAWYAFHGTSSFGSERPEVKSADLLHLPFPASKDLQDPKRSEAAAQMLVSIIDRQIESATAPLAMKREEAWLSEIDKWTFEYFGLSKDEIILIDDTIDCVIPAIQPHQGSYPELWKPPNEQERRAYAITLVRSVGEWLQEGSVVHAQLEAKNADLGILRLALTEGDARVVYTEKDTSSLSHVLENIGQHIHEPLDGNFQLMPDLHVFIGKNLYLIKPMQRRFWLRSAALADADGIAADLQNAMDIDNYRSRA